MGMCLEESMLGQRIMPPKMTGMLESNRAMDHGLLESQLTLVP
jgi:hypothetical protein